MVAGLTQDDRGKKFESRVDATILLLIARFH